MTDWPPDFYNLDRCILLLGRFYSLGPGRGHTRQEEGSARVKGQKTVFMTRHMPNDPIGRAKFRFFKLPNGCFQSLFFGPSFCFILTQELYFVFCLANERESEKNRKQAKTILFSDYAFWITSFKQS